MSDSLAPARDDTYVRSNWTEYRHWLGREATPAQRLEAYCFMSGYEPLPIWIPLHLATPEPDEDTGLPTSNKLAIGGTGGGKSDTCMHELAICLLANPGCDGIVLTPILAQARQTFVPRWKMLNETLSRRGFPLQRRWYGGFGGGTMMSHLVGDAMLSIRPMRDVDNLKGPEYAVAWMDEADQAREPARAMSIIRGRLRAPRAHFYTYLASTNPNGTDRTVAGHFIEARREPAKRRIWYVQRGNWYHNHHLPRNYRETNAQGMSRRRFRQEMLGEILRPATAIYSEFERPRHVIPYTFDPHRPWIIGYDGGDAWEHITAMQQRPDGAWVVFDEWISDETQNELKRRQDLLSWLKVYSQGRLPGAGKLRKPPSHAIADKAHKSSVRWMVHALPTTQVSVLRPEEHSVAEGIEMVRALLDPLEGEPLMYFASHLFEEPVHPRSIARAVENYRYRCFPDGLVDVSSPLQDNVTEHAADSWRMAVVGSSRGVVRPAVRSRYGGESEEWGKWDRRRPVI